MIDETTHIMARALAGSGVDIFGDADEIDVPAIAVLTSARFKWAEIKPRLNDALALAREMKATQSEAA